ncbi:MAG: hypothetical protein M3Y72_01415 [Acidobacteriota bacterium]|nr:hypothetical protein [Acidobacteriota bacterium]
MNPSAARAAINRVNAQLSTGPTTLEGKNTSSLNAVKTGLTGRTVLLHGEDADAYRRHIADYEKEFQPAGLRERELVQSLADTQWRLSRIPGLEAAIFARGAVELETFLKYEKQLRNLQLQESRLQRRYEKESAELRQLQKERRQKEQDSALKPASSGFEFSSALSTGVNSPSTPEPAAPATVSAPSPAAPPR